jgi:hypothetical protein
MMSMIPDQKLGIDTPSKAPTIARRSTTVLRFTAATMPAGKAMSSAMRAALVVSRSVAGSFSTMRSRTGCWARIDRPRSPCATRASQLRYCRQSGWSRPSSVRSASRAERSASWPSMASIGSPGMR